MLKAESKPIVVVVPDKVGNENIWHQEQEDKAGTR
jgi:hypothetical protein